MTVAASAVTGQAHFDSHVVSRLNAAVELVNGLATALALGRTRPLSTPGAEQRRSAAEALAAAGAPDRVVSEADAAALAALAGELREVFRRLDAGDEDGAAARLNRLMSRVDARPRLHRHEDQPWHLHFHPLDASPAEGWTAGCATSLAMVLGSAEAGRLGTCGAADCERVYIDTSRNGSRRFCSLGCQNRVKAAAYRARQARQAGQARHARLPE